MAATFVLQSIAVKNALKFRSVKISEARKEKRPASLAVSQSPFATAKIEFLKNRWVGILVSSLGDFEKISSNRTLLEKNILHLRKPDLGSVLVAKTFLEQHN